ncbi:MAG: hypothetical protein ABJH68_15385 [Ilumatobacter sp.]|uniref:hypothetical protein n=1 Tax=Ilumatobacter sp. TaxID=1967498 RepID=UPI003297BA7E
MKTRIVRSVTASAVAIVAVGAIGVGPVSAKAGDIVKKGDCSGSTDYKFKVQPRGSTFEYEFEVDSNRNGQTWNVRITDNAAAVVTGARKTVAPSGSFTVRGRTANRSGQDAFVAKATNPATGETCTARISA